MTRGLTREQVGVTDAMVDTYGDVIFRYSNNRQLRRGDPVRELDLEAVDARRAELGMSDGQIARKLGLSEAQVTYIRNLEEMKRMQANNFQRLLELGGGRRFREERFTPHEERFTYSERALWLRSSMTFPSDRAGAYFDAGWWAEDTLRAWLEQHASQGGERPAIISAAGTVDYRSLHARVKRVAAGLKRLGVAPGEVVTVQLPNVPEQLIAYLAIVYLGGVTSTLYQSHRSAEMATLLTHSRAKALVCSDVIGDFSPAAAVDDLRAQGGLAELEHVIVVGSAVTPPHPGTVAFRDLEAGEPPPASIEPTPVAADPMLLLYTSGTTAGPKGVPHNAHTLLSNARWGVVEHGIERDDVFLCAAPFGHLFGQYSLQLAWCAGASHVLLPVFTPPALAELVAEHKPSVLFAAPAQLTACLNGGLLESHDWSCLKLVVTAGSAVAPDLVRAVAGQIGSGTVCQLWGMTETQAGAYSRPDDPVEVPMHSAGRPSPGTELRIVDETGAVLAPGLEGELEIRGPLLFCGYLANREANQAAFREGGWFRTGDLARTDAAGNVSLTGRVKDLINRGGIKYNPQEVEDLIDRHPAVGQSAVAPMPDPVLGERACCFVTLAPGQSLSLDALNEYLLGYGIAKLKLPERLEIVDEMPLTPTRKVIKGKLVARLTL